MYIQPRLDLAGKLAARAKMYYLARAGVKRAVLEIERDDTGGYDAHRDYWAKGDFFKKTELSDGGFFSLGYQVSGGNEDEEAGNTAYGLTDEERKININRVTHEVLKNIFEIIADTTLQDASDIADAIIDWRDENDEPRDNGAEERYYSVLNPPYPCKNGDFEILEELLLVKGMTQEIFDKIKDRITIYSDGAVNINTADKLVLRSLGLDEELVDKIMHFRSGVYVDELEKTVDIFQNAGNIIELLNSTEDLSNSEIAQLNRVFSFGLLSVRSDNFMGHSVGQLAEEGNFSRATFVFNRNDRTIKYWRTE